MSEHTISRKRWLAKKGARLGIGAGSLPLTALASHRNRIRVLTYHRFTDELRSPFSVSPTSLARQMEWLGRAGLAVGLEDVEAALAGSPPRAGVVVTMDDGDPSVIRAAAPIFAENHIPYVVFVVPGRIGQTNHMTPAELRELADQGATVASHSMTHRSLASLKSKDLRAEIEDSKKQIEDIVGREVSSLAYPFGTRRDFNQACADALREAGYRLAFTSQHGVVEHGQDPMMVPRIKIEGGDPDWLFRAACRGALDQWRFIDQGLTGLQRPSKTDIAAREA